MELPFSELILLLREFNAMSPDARSSLVVLVVLAMMFWLVFKERGQVKEK